MAILTLNQIVERIRTLSLSHRQVNSFYYGDAHEQLSNGDLTYPVVFLESQPGNIDRVNKIQTFNFRLSSLDLVNVAADTELNETDVLSDRSSVVDDLIAMIANPIYQYDWQISTNIPKGLPTEKNEDMTAGAEVDISITVDYLTDSCQAPADDVEFEQTFNMARTKIHTYTATGSETYTFAVAELANKHILAVYRAGRYKRAVAVAPTDTERIQVGTVDVGSGKGILGDGTCTLETDDLLMADEILDFLYYSE